MKLPILPKFSGEIIIFIEALFFSLFSVLSKLVLNEISPIVVMIMTWGFAGLLFAGIISYKKQWKSLQKHPEQYLNIFLAGSIIGIVFHGLIFYGISLTTAGNAALIGVSEILFSYLLFSIWKKEHEKLLHIAGAFLMSIGIVIAFWKSFFPFEWNKGDLFVFLAFAVVPLGNFFQQKTAKSAVPNEIILFVRTILIFLVFVPLFFVFDTFPSQEIITENIFTLFFIGFFILGFSKLLWVYGISLISVPKATSLSSIYPIFSFIFAYFILGEIPTWYQMGAILPMGIGIYLLVKK